VIRSILGAMGVWLGFFDSLARSRRLYGLNWGGGIAGPLLALASFGLGRPHPIALLFTLPFAIAAQVGLATSRRRALDPKRRLQPGTYSDRVIARVDLPGAHGPVPALHVVPTGGAHGVVLVAHGSGCDKTFYAWRLVDALIAQRSAVVLIDLDGHGESPRPQAFPDILESVAGPARWLRARYKHITVLGMSLGGAVSARAVAEGAPCDALAIWESPPQLRLEGRDYKRVQVAEGRNTVRATLLHLFEDGNPVAVASAWRTSGIRATIGTWDLFDALDLAGSLSRIAAQPERPPLLLVYGGRDALVPPDAAERVRRAGVWGEWRYLADASHLSLPLEPETISWTANWVADQQRS
jgi:pimeloyl-ACP methyl ester carboxylesterase